MSGAKGRSGGFRSGAGRKPNADGLARLHGARDRGAVRPSSQVGDQMPQPDGLSPEVAAVWRKLAPHAVKAGTLVPGTAAAFSRFCVAIVRHAKIEAQIEKDGLTYLKVTIDGSG
jgi:phage terminase small subunit